MRAPWLSWASSGMLDLAQEVLEQGESIVLSTAYRDTAATLAAALTAECLTGDTTT